MRPLIVALALLAACSSKSSKPEPTAGVRLVYQIDVVDDDRSIDAIDAAADRALEVIRDRVDALDIDRPAVFRRVDRIIIELPGATDRQLVWLRASLDRRGRLEIRRLDPSSDAMRQLWERAAEDPAARAAGIRAEVDVWSRPDGAAMRERYLAGPTGAALRSYLAGLSPDLPADREILFERVDPATPGDPPHWRTYLAAERAGIDGHIRDARVATDPQLGQPIVDVTLDDTGRDRFADLTRRALGDKLAIIIDGTILSAPIVQSEIPGGRIQITLGTGEPQALMTEAQSLAAALRTASLPVTLHLMSADRFGDGHN